MPPKDERTKEEIAKANIEETKTAHQMAAEQRQRDLQGGQKPPIVAVADSIRSKLENEEFSQHPGAPTPEAPQA